VTAAAKEFPMPPPPVVTVHTIAEPDRLASQLLLRAYAVVVPPTVRSLRREEGVPVRSEERRREQAR
jgi:hypothetical protein